jgi:hypothetical protein
MKICQLGAELFHVHRQMDITKLTVTFHNLQTRHKMNCSKLMVIGYTADSPKNSDSELLVLNLEFII